MQRERRQGRERDYKNVREMLGVGDLGAKRDHFSRVDFSLGERVVFFFGLGSRYEGYFVCFKSSRPRTFIYLI